MDIVSFLLTGTSLQEIRRHSEERLHLRSAAFPFPECKRRDGDGDEGGFVRLGVLVQAVVGGCGCVISFCESAKIIPRYSKGPDNNLKPCLRLA